ncbi:hypothetical protein OFO12_05300 [Campylobacter sp. JMF_04 NA10]|nr:hypothetical protein [Campylobacter sp. JMF_04 NA10]
MVYGVLILIIYSHYNEYKKLKISKTQNTDEHTLNKPDTQENIYQIVHNHKETYNTYNNEYSLLKQQYQKILQEYNELKRELDFINTRYPVLDDDIVNLEIINARNNKKN